MTNEKKSNQNKTRLNQRYRMDPEAEDVINKYKNIANKKRTQRNTNSTDSFFSKAVGAGKKLGGNLFEKGRTFVEGQDVVAKGKDLYEKGRTFVEGQDVVAKGKEVLETAKNKFNEFKTRAEDIYEDSAILQTFGATGRIWGRKIQRSIIKLSDKAYTNLQKKAADGDELADITLDIFDKTARGITSTKAFFEDQFKNVQQSQQVARLIPNYSSFLDYVASETNKVASYDEKFVEKGIAVTMKKTDINQVNNKYQFSLKFEKDFSEGPVAYRSCEVLIKYANKTGNDFEDILSSVAKSAVGVLRDDVSKDGLDHILSGKRSTYQTDDNTTLDVNGVVYDYNIKVKIQAETDVVGSVTEIVYRPKSKKNNLKFTVKNQLAKSTE